MGGVCRADTNPFTAFIIIKEGALVGPNRIGHTHTQKIDYHEESSAIVPLDPLTKRFDSIRPDKNIVGPTVLYCTVRLV